MHWRPNDLAICLVGNWYDSDGFPLVSYPPAGPDMGQMLKVETVRTHPDFGSVDLRIRGWPDAWFDAAGFQRIPPPKKRAERKQGQRA